MECTLGRCEFFETRPFVGGVWESIWVRITGAPRRRRPQKGRHLSPRSNLADRAGRRRSGNTSPTIPPVVYLGLTDAPARRRERRSGRRTRRSDGDGTTRSRADHGPTARPCSTSPRKEISAAHDRDWGRWRPQARRQGARDPSRPGAMKSLRTRARARGRTPADGRRRGRSARREVQFSGSAEVEQGEWPGSRDLSGTAGRWVYTRRRTARA